MKIILAEDHNIIREGLKKLLEEDSSIQIVGEAKNGKEAVELANKLNPDLILMDISMPVLNGIEATKKIKKKHPEIKILILSMYDNEEYIKQLLNIGAEGYLLKETLVRNLFSALKVISKGGTYLDSKISEQLIKDYNLTRPGKKIETTYDTLSAKEKEVLKLIGEGHSNKEIAGLLCRSVKTIETHRSNIMRKLSIHKLADLIRYAIKKGL
ncbi:MAG: response regulator transcription factor [bacterium]|nr:response regulator transcription factor [bacterium]